MNRTGHPDWVKMFGDSNGQNKFHAKRKYKFLSATNLVQVLDQSAYNLLCAVTPRKDMDPSLLSTTIGQVVG